MITVQELDGKVFNIQLDTQFDFESHKEFTGHIQTIMQKKPTALVLNFDKLDYLDSSGLGMLMMARQEAQEQGCSIAIINVHDGHPKKVLELMKFHHYFTIQTA